MKSNFNLCVLQPEINPGEAEENLDSIQRLAETACGEPAGIDLMVLPENFFLRTVANYSEEAAHTAREFLQSLARSLSVNLVGGSFHRFDPHSESYFNICYIVDRKGTIIGSYRKQHPFDRELKYGVEAGSKSEIFEIEGWKVGVLICADLWYPETASAFRRQVDIIAVPSQSVVRSREYQRYGRELWEALALTRAQENAAVTAVADHPALSREPFCSGAASICDPSMGFVTQDLSLINRRLSGGSPGSITAELDYGRLSEFRRYRAGRGMPSGG